MKIIISAKKMVPPLTGVGAYTHQLAGHLLRQNPAPQLALFGLFFRHYFARRAFLRRCAAGDTRVFTLPVPDRLMDWCWAGGWGAADRVLKGYDLYHATDYLVPALKRIPLVATLHDVSVFACPQFHTPFNVRYFQRQITLLMQRSRRVLADSQWTASEAARLFPDQAHKIRCVPLGVESSYFCRVDAAELRRVQRRYDLPEEYFLFVGTLEPRKNMEGLLRAYALLKKETRERFALALVGRQGWMQDNVPALLREKGLQDRVRLLGYAAEADMPALYQGASVFVYPSFYEGFGLPVAEAMASGVPTICSDNSSLAEIAGDGAWKINPREPEALREALETLAGNAAQARDMAARGVKRARCFDWNGTAERTVSVYREVLA